jgi:predicted nucleic acid-binding protein
MNVMGSPTTSKVRAKVFLDSSVLLAASLSTSGSAADLLFYANQGDVALCLSQDVLVEVRRNLQLKAPQGLARFKLLQDQLPTPIAAPSQELVAEVALVVEAKDALAAAITANASYIVSYDRRHLVGRSVDIQSAFGTPVFTPADLLLTLGLPLIDHRSRTDV